MNFGLDMDRNEDAQESELKPYIDKDAIKARLFDKIEKEREKIRNPRNPLSNPKERKLPSVQAIIDIVAISEKSEIVRVFKR